MEKLYQVEVDLNGKFLINVKATSMEEAKQMAKETFEQSTVKEALTKWKNNLKIDAKIKPEPTREER